jgi:hypothetical protein
MLPCDRLAYQDGMVSKAPTGQIVRRVLLIAALAPVVVLCTTILWVYQRADEEPRTRCQRAECRCHCCIAQPTSGNHTRRARHRNHHNRPSRFATRRTEEAFRGVGAPSGCAHCQRNVHFSQPASALNPPRHCDASCLCRGFEIPVGIPFCVVPPGRTRTGAH